MDNEPYVHIQIHPSTIPIDKLKELIAKDWKAGALKFHAFDATYHEKNDEERAWVTTARAFVELRKSVV